MPRRFTAHASANAGLKRKSNDPTYDNLTVKRMIQSNGLGNRRERESVSAVETKTHLMLAISNENMDRVSEDGSTFTLPLESSNLKIPDTAFNVNARLVDVVVPYTWPNLTNDGNEKLRFEIEEEIQYRIIEHPGYSTTTFASLDDVEKLFDDTSSSGTPVVAFKSATDQNKLSDTFSGSTLTEDINFAGLGLQYVEFTTTTTLANIDVPNSADFAFHLVWEEPTPTAPFQSDTREIIFRTETFDLVTEVSTTTGLRRLILDFYNTSTTATQYVLSENYLLDKTNVLTILYDYDNTVGVDEKLYILYNDILQVNGIQFSTTGTRTEDTTILQGAHATRKLRIPFIAFIPSPTNVLLGESSTAPVTTPTAAPASHWFCHGFLVNAFKGTFETVPHVKLLIAGLDAADGTAAGTVIEIPVLHDDDNDLTFGTLPKLLGYMQRVINQYIFRNFYFTDFLSMDLIDNPVNNSNGTDYLIQFDYDLSRASSVATLDSSYQLIQNMYNTEGHKMQIQMLPTPYFMFKVPTNALDGSNNLVSISLGGSTYNFDIGDLSSVVNASHDGTASNNSPRQAFAASREDIAHFVYDCIYRAFEADARDLILPAPWEQRTSQPTNSPITAVHRNSALIVGINEDDGTDTEQEMQWDYRVIFSGVSNFLKTDGSNASITSFTIDLTGLAGTDRVPDILATDRVSGTFSGNPFTHTGAAAAAAGDYINIFNSQSDECVATITYDNGHYNADHFEQYTNEALNEFFMSNTHGSSGSSNLFRLNRNEFSQELQLGFLCGREDPVLPSLVRFGFPNQTTTTSNGIAQMLFAGIDLDLTMDAGGGSAEQDLDKLACYASGSESGYEYHPPIEGFVSHLLARPTFALENSQAITIDFSRVHSSLAGTNHLILARDERTRIFSVNPFTVDIGSTGDLNTEPREIEIVIPTGSYTPATLSDEINYQLHIADPELARDIILVRELIPQQKIQLGALVSSDINNSFPHKVVIKAQDSSGNAPTAFANLIGWDLTTGDITLDSPDYRAASEDVRFALTTSLQNPHSFRTRQLLVRASFVANSTAPDGQSRQILAAFAPRVGPGENIIFNPNVPIVTSVKGYLTGDKAAEFLRFELLDASTNLPLGVGTSNPWSVQFMIEYQLQIKQSQIQTQANAPNTISGF